MEFFLIGAMAFGLILCVSPPDIFGARFWRKFSGRMDRHFHDGLGTILAKHNAAMADIEDRIKKGP